MVENMRWPWSKKVPETKASKTGPLIWAQTRGRPSWTPRDYEHLAKEAYVQNTVAHRCVRLVSEAAAHMPVSVFEGNNELANHPLVVLLNKPNPFQGKADLLTSVYSFLQLSGNAYLEFVSVGNSRELHCLRPDRMKVVPGRDGYPDAYEYTVGSSIKRWSFNAGVGRQLPVLHLKRFHPTNDQYGLSAVEPAGYAIDVHNEANKFNKSLLENGARPSGALVYEAPDGSSEGLSDEQFHRLKLELESGQSGPMNAGRPLLLEGGLKWQEMGVTPKDLDFIEGKRESAREIALAFGVPPMLMGIPGDNTYSNYQEANRAFYRQTVIPLVMSVLQSMTNFFSPSFGDTFSLTSDLDTVEALAEERKALWDRVNNAKFLTVDEKREAVGYDAYKPANESDIGARIYSPVSEQPLGTQPVDQNMGQQNGNDNDQS